MTALVIPVGRKDHALGPEDAPVTLVEYGDYQCPHCGKAYPILKAAQALLGKRLRFVFRNFPISELHPHATQAAQFAEAAAGIGKFWEAHDILYENQDALGTSDLLVYGERIGLYGTLLADAFEGRFDERIRADFLGGVRSGVNGTPTLFVNGQRYDGARDLDTLVMILGRERAA